MNIVLTMNEGKIYFHEKKRDHYILWKNSAILIFWVRIMHNFSLLSIFFCTTDTWRFEFFCVIGGSDVYIYMVLFTPTHRMWHFNLSNSLLAIYVLCICIVYTITLHILWSCTKRLWRAHWTAIAKKKFMIQSFSLKVHDHDVILLLHM